MKIQYPFISSLFIWLLGLVAGIMVGVYIAGDKARELMGSESAKITVGLNREIRPRAVFEATKIRIPIFKTNDIDTLILAESLRHVEGDPTQLTDVTIYKYGKDGKVETIIEGDFAEIREMSDLRVWGNVRIQNKKKGETNGTDTIIERQSTNGRNNKDK